MSAISSTTIPSGVSSAPICSENIDGYAIWVLFRYIEPPLPRPYTNYVERWGGGGIYQMSTLVYIGEGVSSACPHRQIWWKFYILFLCKLNYLHHYSYSNFKSNLGILSKFMLVSEQVCFLGLEVRNLKNQADVSKTTNSRNFGTASLIRILAINRYHKW